MNNTQLRFYFKVLIFTLLFFFACGFQTSFWPNLISFLPSPQIWLIMMIYITLRWPPLFGIFYIYFLALCLTSFSDVPLKMLWSCLPIMFVSLWFVKDRIQLTGAFSFILLSLLGSCIFEISYYYLSDLLEVIPTSFMFIDRLLQILVNFIFCYPLYFAFGALDTMLFDQDEWKKSSRTAHEVNPHE